MASPFAEFHDRAESAAEGVHLFRLDPARLKAAAASVRLAAGSAKDGKLPVRCVLTPHRIKLAAYAQGCFAEEAFDLAGPADGVPPEGRELVVDLATLTKVAASFPPGEVHCSHDARRALLTVSAAHARIEAPVLPRAGFTDYRAKVGWPAFVAALPVETLRKGLGYAALFSPDDGTTVSHVDVCDVAYKVMQNGKEAEVVTALVAGGSHQSILSYQSPSLRSVDLRAKFACQGFLGKALARLDPATAQLHRTDAFFLLTDGTRVFGFERPDKGYPVDAALRQIAVRPDDIVQAPRPALRAALTRLASVSDLGSLVQLVAAGSDADATLTVRIADPSGRIAEDTLPVRRVQRPGSEAGRPREALLKLGMLEKVLKYFHDPLATIAFTQRAALVYDRDPDGTATSALFYISPPGTPC